MLPFKVIFQSLDGKYFLFYFTWNFSCIHAKSVISQQVVYSSFQSNILLMFVLIFIKYTKVINKEPVSLQ